MSTLRERTNCFKVVEGDGDIIENGRWLNVRETSEGGAVIDVKADDLECLDKLNEKLGGLDGRVIEAILDDVKGQIILVDEKGQIPFDEVMKAILD
ncbi:MAG TPA: hypothetical protein VLH94_02935 [Spirochaetia bacterium]|nr:hypothetical protein [Spirochaetia bacterium]